MTIIRNPLLLLLLLLPDTTLASFFPFLGCDEQFSWSVPDSDDCYAVDSYMCSFAYSTGCKQITGSYLYYIGGERRDGGQTYSEEVYQTVTIDADTNCGGVFPNTCSVTVNGETCSNGCTNNGANYKTVTLTGCSNLPGVFGGTPQTITLEAGGGHLKLANNETRCQHPAIANRKKLEITGNIVYNMDNDGPSQAESSDLVVATDEWFNTLLAREFTLFQDFSVLNWITRFAGGGTVGTLNLDYNATVVFDPADTTTTIPQVATVMTNATHMEWYVQLAVKPANDQGAFEGVETATATVVPRVVRR